MHWSNNYTDSGIFDNTNSDIDPSLQILRWINMKLVA